MNKFRHTPLLLSCVCDSSSLFSVAEGPCMMEWLLRFNVDIPSWSSDGDGHDPLENCFYVVVVAS